MTEIATRQPEQERRQNWFTAMKHYLQRRSQKRVAGKTHRVDAEVTNPIRTLDTPVCRFEQLNHEDRWSRTTYHGPPEAPRPGCVQARIQVQDPRDPDDVHLPNIEADEVEEDEAKARNPGKH